MFIKSLEDPLAEEILKSNPKEGDLLQVDFDKKTEELKISVKQVQKASKE